MGDVPDHLPGAVPGSWTLSRGCVHFDADLDCTPAKRRPGVPYGNLHHRRCLGNHVSILSACLTYILTSTHLYMVALSKLLQSVGHLEQNFYTPKQQNSSSQQQTKTRILYLVHCFLVLPRIYSIWPYILHDASYTILEILLHDKKNTESLRP